MQIEISHITDSFIRHGIPHSIIRHGLIPDNKATDLNDSEVPEPVSPHHESV